MWRETLFVEQPIRRVESTNLIFITHREKERQRERERLTDKKTLVS